MFLKSRNAFRTYRRRKLNERMDQMLAYEQVQYLLQEKIDKARWSSLSYDEQMDEIDSILSCVTPDMTTLERNKLGVEAHNRVDSVHKKFEERGDYTTEQRDRLLRQARALLNEVFLIGE